MIIDGHSHACGKFLTSDSIIKNLDNSGVDKVILVPGELNSNIEYSLPNLAALFPRQNVVKITNYLTKFAIKLTGKIKDITVGNEYPQAYTKTIFPESDGEFSVINIIKGSLGMIENTSLEVEIYPNPASDIMNIVSNNTITHIKVLNFIGQTMLEKAVNETKLSINTSAYQSGIYFIRIKTANGIKTEKLTIK